MSGKESEFGSSRAAIVLSDMLQKEPHCHRPVMRLFNDFCLTLHQIEIIKRSATRAFVYYLVRSDYCNKIQKSRWPATIKTYALNIVIAKCKLFEKTFEINPN